MVEDKKLSEKEIAKRIVDLKIEILKTPTKKASIKREIARLLTMAKTVDGRRLTVDGKKDKTLTKLEDKK